ncbi:MAG: hypothetical protein F6K30_15435 [Cyanothece sp. SIO2G6]|nr:hypothetical protein [Cyanothece sp. SIO2G6]
MVELFYRVRRCGVRFIRYILGNSPRHSSYVPLRIPQQFYFQLRAIAAHQRHCSPADLPPSAVAATLADLIELGLYSASLPRQTFPTVPTVASESSELAHLWAKVAAMQQRLERLEAWGSHLTLSTQPHSVHADYSVINGQIESRLMPITEQLKRLERQIYELRDQIHELRHPLNNSSQAISANLHDLKPQMQTLTSQIHDLHMGMEQMNVQRADWQQTFLSTQQQLQGLEQKVIQLSSEMGQLQSMRSYQLEHLPQTTGQPPPSRTYEATVRVQQPCSSQPTSQVAPSIKRSVPPPAATPHSQKPPNTIEAPNTTPPNTIEAEILHTSRLTDIDWERSPHSPLLDLEGITQLELCNRFGLSHHTLVRDSQKAGFSSVPAYLEAKTGFHARQVGRWWRYYSGREET